MGRAVRSPAALYYTILGIMVNDMVHTGAGASGPAGGPAGGSSSDRMSTAQAKYAKEVNAYTNDYIRFADVKAGAVLTLTVAVAGALGNAIHSIVAAANNHSAVKGVLAVSCVLAAFATAVSIVFSTFCLIPRVTSLPSLNSFPDIANLEPDAYAAKVAALTETEIANNLSIHNVTLARIALKKFDAITIAVRALFVLLFSGFVVVLLYVFASIA